MSTQPLLTQQTQGERQRFSRQDQGASSNGNTNVSDGERIVSLAAGSILAILGLGRGGVAGLITAGVGGGLIYRGATGTCPMYSALDIDTAHKTSRSAQDTEHGIHIEQTFLINKSPEELFRFWRNFENLPQIMTHLKSVTVQDDRRSHWVAKAPKIAGGEVEWDAEITDEQPNQSLKWRSIAGSSVDLVGEIRFTPAMGDRGTEVHVFMNYSPPAGRLGHWVATLFGESPRRQMRDDLRNFKSLMETGEIPVVKGQPRGNCGGLGKLFGN